MELWIRSQDKKLLCKCDSLFIEEEPYKRKGKYRIMANNGWLGEYDKLERTLEVLDEIQQYLNNNCEFIERKTHTSMGNYIDKIKFYVYEMPEE